jgi:carboxyvinyl-carboxyphosphonate phosphorylmutase
MHWTPRRERFRALLAGTACVNPGSVFDPMSARIAEDLGYTVGILAGSVASMAAIGAPDLIVLTLTELAEQCLRIGRAGSLPLLVDADHGYGNALNVRRTVEELETAGVAALSIEDTELPQPFGTGSKARLISIEEGVGKMKAALDARQDPSLIIAGRTSAAGMTGIEEAIARAKAYEKAGVDALFMVGIRSRGELEALRAEVKLPVILAHGGEALSDLDYLAGQGVRVRLQPHLPIQAAVQAIYATMKALRDGTPPSEIAGTAPAELMKRVTRDADYKSWMRAFLN